MAAEHGWFVVPVVVNEADTLRFILDTGAAVSAVTASTARRLGMPADGLVTAQGASGAQRLPTVRIHRITLAGIPAVDLRALVLEEETLTPFGGREEGYAPYDGVAGWDLFGSYDLLVDPVAGVLRLYGGRSAPEPAILNALAPPLPLRRIAGPIVGHDVTVNGATLPAILDTGARRVVLSPRGARIAGVRGTSPSRGSPAPSGVGTEVVAVRDGEAQRLVAGTTDLGPVPVQVGPLPIFRGLGYGDRSVLLLGNPALAGCPFLLSYRDDTVRYCREPDVPVLSTTPGGPDSVTPGEEWTRLFNGRDLDGWTPKIRGHEAGEDPRGTFRVEDGLLTVGYEGYGDFQEAFGHLFFRTPFSRYVLRVEYRFVGEQLSGGPGWALRNSGVMFHAQSPESMFLDQDFPISLEAQFLGGDGTHPRPTANLCTPGTHVEMDGVLVQAHCVEAAGPTFHGEEWVTVELVVRGGASVAHVIQGDTVLAYARPVVGGGGVSDFDPALKVDGRPLTGGFIALQSESHPVQFRKVWIRPLPG
ncbi:MAG TPA: family 16 glycoside hydrolase [Longimicrobiales bacterium]|nr:family 16 glycoside hydrolase [Longimicrobiales bacterium]